MDDSNYQPPRADLGTEQLPDVDQDVLKRIKNGWVAALISAGITLAITLFVVVTGETAGLFGLWNLIDVGLILALAYGIYRKSRVAATIMFLYFVGSQILSIMETGRASGILLSLVFAYFYLHAMIATYQYHQQISGSSRG